MFSDVLTKCNEGKNLHFIIISLLMYYFNLSSHALNVLHLSSVVFRVCLHSYFPPQSSLCSVLCPPCDFDTCCCKEGVFTHFWKVILNTLVSISIVYRSNLIDLDVVFINLMLMKLSHAKSAIFTFIVRNHDHFM